MTGPPGARTRLVFGALTVLLVLVVLEAGARGILAVRAGLPALLYGFGDAARSRRTLALHDDLRSGYSKYAPHAVLRDFDPDTGEGFAVHVNAAGFRGADWTDAKPPGTVRIVTLGASSTFGYHARDDETWPVRLQEILRARCPAGRYEVLNLGMPHLMSEEILALFRAEALPLQPDVVTFYEGVNDASMRRDRNHVRRTLRRIDVLRASYRALRDHLVLVHLADDLVRPHAERWDADAVRAHTASRVEPFLEHLEAIRTECEARGILLVVATQQAASLEVPRGRLRGLTYEAEADSLRRRLDAGGTVSTPAMSFLAHAVLMQEEREWAAGNGVPLVDVVAALDGRRDVLVSWVHLTPEGNRLLAEAFAPVLLERTCPGGAAGTDAGAAGTAGEGGPTAPGGA